MQCPYLSVVDLVSEWEVLDVDEGPGGEGDEVCADLVVIVPAQHRHGSQLLHLGPVTIKHYFPTILCPNIG